MYFPIKAAFIINSATEALLIANKVYMQIAFVPSWWLTVKPEQAVLCRHSPAHLS